jgi:Flp pilus assembly protein TadG
MSTWLHSKRSGQELVEFAVVLPFLLVVVVGVLDLGRAFHAVITITNVAREGARYGVDFDWNNRSLPDPITTGYTEIETVAFLEAQDSRLDLTNMAVTSNCGLCEEDSQLTVTVTYDFELILGFLPDFTMTRFATMMVP